MAQEGEPGNEDVGERESLGEPVAGCLGPARKGGRPMISRRRVVRSYGCEADVQAMLKSLRELVLLALEGAKIVCKGSEAKNVQCGSRKPGRDVELGRRSSGV